MLGFTSGQLVEELFSKIHPVVVVVLNYTISDGLVLIAALAIV